MSEDLKLQKMQNLFLTKAKNNYTILIFFSSLIKQKVIKPRKMLIYYHLSSTSKQRPKNLNFIHFNKTEIILYYIDVSKFDIYDIN